jgi:hypothetical protein
MSLPINHTNFKSTLHQTHHPRRCLRLDSWVSGENDVMTISFTSSTLARSDYRDEIHPRLLQLSWWNPSSPAPTIVIKSPLACSDYRDEIPPRPLQLSWWNPPSPAPTIVMKSTLARSNYRDEIECWSSTLARSNYRDEIECWSSRRHVWGL